MIRQEAVSGNSGFGVVDVPLAPERRHDRRGHEQQPQRDDHRGRDLVERRLVLDQRRADRGRAEAQQDEDRREARDEEQAGPEHAPRLLVGELGR